MKPQAMLRPIRSEEFRHVECECGSTYCGAFSELDSIRTRLRSVMTLSANGGLGKGDETCRN